jgi:hypothetical protein
VNNPSLGHEKDLLRVGIFYFGAGRETFHIDIFAGRIWALDQVLFSWNRNSIRIIAFGGFRCGSGRRWTGSGRCFLSGGCFGWRWAVGIKRLLLGRVLLRLVRIFRDPLLHTRGRLLRFSARTDEEAGNERERQQRFHKDRFDEAIALLIRCQSLNGWSRRAGLNFFHDYCSAITENFRDARRDLGRVVTHADDGVGPERGCMLAK